MRLCQSTCAVILVAAIVPSVLLAKGLPAQGPEAVQRTLRGRQKALSRLPSKVKQSIHLGLTWLDRHQDDDGRFSATKFMKHDKGEKRCDGKGSPVNDLGVTGLALLAFMGSGNGPKTGPYCDAVDVGLDWIMHQQHSKTGRIGKESGHAYFYCHVIATLALLEGSAFEASEELRSAASRAVRYILSAHNKGAGWRYRPKDGNSDSSVTGWCLHVLYLARELGIDVNPKTVADAEGYLIRMRDSYRGQIGYTEPNQPSARKEGLEDRYPYKYTEALTAIGLSTLLHGGQNPRDAMRVRQAEQLLRRPPKWLPKDGAVDFYYWFHASQAMAAMGGRFADEWQRLIEGVLLPHQRRDGNFSGSWFTDCPWGEDGGRVYATAVAVLSLEAPCRSSKLADYECVPKKAPFSNLQREWKKRRLVAVDRELKRLAKLELDAAQKLTLAAIQRRFQATMARMTRLLDAFKNEKDYLYVVETCEWIRDAFPKGDLSQRAAGMLESLTNNRVVQGQLLALRELQKLEARFPPKTARKKESLRIDLRVFLRTYQEGLASSRARALLSEF